MKKILIAGLVFLLAQTAHAQANKEAQQNIDLVENGLCNWFQTAQGIKWNLADRMAYYKVNGVSIAVIDNYKIAWAKAYGWADNVAQVPAGVHTRFQAASISKSLNALAILQLAEQHKLDLNEDINYYLKRWKFPYDSLAHHKKITAWELITHTAGLTVHGFAGYKPGDSLPSLTQILDGKRPANNKPIRSFTEPGKKPEYSGGGIEIAQLLVEDISGKSYEAYMKENVLQPLNMHESSYASPATFDSRQLASGYYSDGRAVESGYRIYPEKAAAGLLTTATDLAKFIIAVQWANHGDKKWVLSPEMARQQLQTVADSNTAAGIFIEHYGGLTYIQHSGANEGFRSQYYGCLSNGKGVVILTNSNNPTLINEVINSVATVYHWQGFYRPEMREVIALTSAQQDACLGKYDMDGQVLTILKKNGQLYIDKVLSWQLFFSSPSDFFVAELKGNFKLTTDDAGKVNGFTFNGSKAKKIE